MNTIEHDIYARQGRAIDLTCTCSKCSKIEQRPCVRCWFQEILAPEKHSALKARWESLRSRIPYSLQDITSNIRTFLTLDEV